MRQVCTWKCALLVRGSLIGSMSLLAIATNVAFSEVGHAHSPGVIAAPAEKPAAPAAPKPKPGPSCTLLTPELPRGGRLEVEGSGFGKAPLVRIGDKVTRIIERTETTMAVQVPKDSDGGEVTVQAGTARAVCGTLTIIGKDG